MTISRWLYSKKNLTIFLFFASLFFQMTFAIITLFRAITMLCGIDIILHNIPTFNLNVRNIQQNIVNPA